MARKKKEKSLDEQIKQMEQEKRKESIAKVSDKKPEKKVSFDSWFHQRKDQIKSCHKKEILMADFKARGLSSKATMAEFDKALELYGVKLK
jgi:hypothetical protein